MASSKERAGERATFWDAPGFGRLDVYFANAGVGGPMSIFTDQTAEDFTDVFRVRHASACLVFINR